MQLNPTLIGAIGVLITMLAIFISYNANNGLPFVPTYQVYVELPDGQGLTKGSQVRIGGYRVGFIQRIDGGRTPDGKGKAILSLKLNKSVEPLRVDSRTRVRPQSLLGLKYLDILPGTKGAAIRAGGTIPASRNLPNVDIEEVFAAFDPKTVRNVKSLLRDLGTGFAGRGQDLNAAFAAAPGLLRDANPVLAQLADPATRTAETIRSFARLAAELAPVAPQLSRLFGDAATTLHALDAAGPELEQALADSPETFRLGTSTLTVLGPVITKARELTHEFRPASDLLPQASTRLATLIGTGTPIARRALPLAEDLDAALNEVHRLASAHQTALTTRKLDAAVGIAKPVVEYAAPAQLLCNYLGITYRNLASTVSEGSAGGTWLRFYPMFPTDEILARGDPAPNLHFNPYPNFGAPGQERECEAGNEPYLPGQRLGNVPGNQGTVTENTKIELSEP